MRGLFPAETGGDPRAAASGQARVPITHSVSPSRSNTGVSARGASTSRPNPTATRSPTVPPVVVSPQPGTSGSARFPQSRPNAVIPPPAPSGLLHWSVVGIPGWVVMSALLLLGFAFVGGALWTLRGPTSGQVATRAPIPEIQLLDLAFESSPIGADVYIVGSNEYLGRTPFRRKVEYRSDRNTFVVFRLAGYHERTKEVRPDWSGMVTLQAMPVPTPPPARPAPSPPIPAPKPPPTVSPKPVPVRPHGKADPFERPRKRRGKSKGKVSDSHDRPDPFENDTDRRGLERRKSSPF
jgi:hypothetical protein